MRQVVIIIIIIVLRHTVGLLWTSDKPVAKASTYIRQHNTETQRQKSMVRAGFEPNPSNQAAKTYRRRQTHSSDNITRHSCLSKTFVSFLHELFFS
jgi:uncharacterized protein YxeA